MIKFSSGHMSNTLPFQHMNKFGYCSSFNFFTELMNITAPHSFDPFPRGREILFLGGTRANALTCPMFSLFPTTP